VSDGRTLEIDVTAKSKKILRWFSAALVIWILSGAVAGSFTVPARRSEFDTKSPDSKKEFYLYRPFYRRAIYGMMYPIEWSVKLVTAVFAGSPDGNLYFPEYSLYVRDIASGRSHRYSPIYPGVWSPDSRWIACEGLKKDERPSLLLIDTNEQREYVVLSPNSPPNWSIQDITWSVDGTAVFFRQEYTVYAVDIISKSLVAIAEEVRGDSIDVLQIVTKWKAMAGRENQGTGTDIGKMKD
jgi:Tol biopolymer transport system component